jgi:release factor glutamine methyltransferase
VAGSIRLDEALQSAAQQLRDISENPAMDAQLLLSHALDRERSWLLAHPEYQLHPPQQETFEQLVERVQLGEALPYVVGERWFFGRLFSIEPQVLIPRPETELLVEAALEFLQERPHIRRAVDVGTGSGCIAVTLCGEHPQLEMLAIDKSFSALQVAKQNKQRLTPNARMSFLVGDLLRSLKAEFDLICANLPYIPSGRLASLEVARREPMGALDGGSQGLDQITRLAFSLDEHLAAGGRAILEIDETQGAAVTRMVGEILPGCGVVVRKDLAGMDRVVVIDRQG